MTQAEKEAAEYGIDLNLLEYNLSLTCEKRLEQHQEVLNLANEIRKNTGKMNGQPESSA